MVWQSARSDRTRVEETRAYSRSVTYWSARCCRHHSRKVIHVDLAVTFFVILLVDRLQEVIDGLSVPRVDTTRRSALPSLLAHETIAFAAPVGTPTTHVILK